MFPSYIYRFGTFELNASERLLTFAGQPVPIQPRQLDILLFLVQRPGQPIGSQELAYSIWRTKLLDPALLHQHISRLRRVLGSQTDYIKSVRSGYVFVKPVNELVELPWLASDGQLKNSRRLHIPSERFYSCFISYSHKDELFAEQLHARMQNEKLQVWYAPEEMKGGEKLHEQIFSAIQAHDKLLLILSEESMTSEWVATEIRRARRQEREQNRRKLFPIRLVDFEKIQQWECFDADSGKDLAVELREYFIPDFSNWKDHDAFEAAFARLLKNLNASAEKP